MSSCLKNYTRNKKESAYQQKENKVNQIHTTSSL